MMIALLLGLLACDEAPVDHGARGDCNPVDVSQCLYPFPNDFFLEEDASTGTGMRVAFGETSLPVDRDGVQVNPRAWNERDGFPILGEMRTFLPSATVDGLSTTLDIGSSLSWSSNSIVLNTETGERLPHWVEFDMSARGPSKRSLIIRPAVAMEHNTRYIVALRGVVDSDGEELDAVEGFAWLASDRPSNDPDLERQRDHYDADIFPLLEEQGFKRGQLQQAWDFTTGSVETTLADPLYLRDVALEYAQDNEIGYRIDDVTESSCTPREKIFRSITGVIEVPNYLTPDHEPGSTLLEDDDGVPVQNGMGEVPFTMRIPCSILRTGDPGPLVQVTHGLFLGHTFVTQDAFDNLTSQEELVVFGLSFTGMSDDDVGEITLAIAQQFDRFEMVPDRLMQGHLEHLLAGELMTGAFADDPAVAFPDDEDPDGAGGPMYDPSELYLLASSQGAILGGATLAMSPRIERAVVNVGGMPFSLLLPRAVLFEPFFLIIQEKFDDDLDVSVIFNLMGMLWEPAESAGWAHHITEAPLEPDLPERRLLLHAAIGDASVSTLGAHIYARSVGAKLIEPSNRDVWGLQTTQCPSESGSAFREFEYGIPEPDIAVPVNADLDPHMEPLRSATSQEMMGHFFRTGEFINSCSSSCDPE